MPIYEFYCSKCNVVFSFFSRSVNTTKRPKCPRCDKPRLDRQVSMFSATGSSKDTGNPADDLPIDEAKMVKAMGMLAGEAENIDENDPRKAASLMKKLSDVTGLQFGKGMQEAIGRLEAGEDPESIEAEMGALLDDDEDPFVLPDKKPSGTGRRERRPERDSGLYDL